MVKQGTPTTKVEQIRTDAQGNPEEYVMTHQEGRFSTPPNEGGRRGRTVEVNTKDFGASDRELEVQWRDDFSDYGRNVGVSADEAVRKTDFEVYETAINAALSIPGVTKLVFNGAWRPDYRDHVKITGTAPGYTPKSKHITSWALDVKFINDVEIKNFSGYGMIDVLDEKTGKMKRVRGPKSVVPPLVKQYREALAQQPGVNQIFSPWQMKYGANKDWEYNEGKPGNDILHHHHLHFDVKK